MKFGATSLVAASLLASVRAGGGGETEAPKAAPVTVTVTVEKWQDVEAKTVYLTSTIKDVQYKTETITITETEVKVKPTTVVETVTVTETEVEVKPTTIVDKVTVIETEVEVKPTTIVDTVTAVDTITDVDTVTVVETEVETDVSTVTATVVEEDTTTVTVTDCPEPPPETLTGLVLCPSRITNPTYTPKKPLPTDYHWGCPPGTLCTPPQIDCNFERNPPAEGYVCAPEECKPVPPIPDYVNVTGESPTDANCAWYKPPPGFFNLNPETFDLSYAIFDIYGQPLCEVPSKGWGDSNWGDWNKGKPPRRFRTRRNNNPLAYLLHRQLANPPSSCYAVYNEASVTGQATGLVYSELCSEGAPFQQAIAQCLSCAANAEDATEGDPIPELQEYLNYCNDREE